MLAFEVKAHSNNDPGKFKDALFQASKYVGAQVQDSRFALESSPTVDGAVVFPAPPYKWPSTAEQFNANTYVLTGIAFMAERLNVGRLVQRQSDWEIVFGPNDVWSKKKGWMGNAAARFRKNGIVTALKKEGIEPLC